MCRSTASRSTAAKTPKVDIKCIKWKKEHRQMFEMNNIDYPPRRSCVDLFRNIGLGNREAQIVYFMEVTMLANTQCCIDVSQSWPSRMPIGYNNEVPCLTGSTNMLLLLRKDAANIFHARRILPIELLALQGMLSFCLSSFKRCTSQGFIA